MFASDNEPLKKGVGHRVARGEALGGTALSNPMKSFFGIEHMRLKGRRGADGYIVNGALPYVSNLGDDHYFGAIFEIDDGSRKHDVMAIVAFAAEGVNLSANTNSRLTAPLHFRCSCATQSYRMPGLSPIRRGLRQTYSRRICCCRPAWPSA